MLASVVDRPRTLPPPRRDDPRFNTPLYKKTEAAKLVRVSLSTFNGWHKQGLVTVLEEHEGFSVPFAGVAEATMVSALRQLPPDRRFSMQSLREIVNTLKREHPDISPHWLISERFYRAGSDLLVEMSKEPSKILDLVKPPSMQGILTEVVKNDLKPLRLDFCNRGYAKTIHPPAYKPETGVAIDPRRGSGRPVFIQQGVLVDVIVGGYAAGEGIKELSSDYKIPEPHIEDVLRVALRKGS